MLISLPQERVDDINNMLATIVRTSIDKNANPQLTDEDINKKLPFLFSRLKERFTFDESNHNY